MPTLQDLRAKLPELEGLDDDTAVNVIQQVYYPTVGVEKIAARLGLKPPAPPEPEAPGLLRSTADTGVALAKGGALGVKMLSDAFGADNPVSNLAGKAVDAIGSLESNYSKWEQQQSAADMKAAEDSGSAWEEVKAAGRSFARRPIDFTAEALGTSLPTIAAAFLPGGQGAAIVRIGAMLGLGGAQGAGAVKGQIYDAVKGEWVKAGAAPEEAERRAAAAQEYLGSNAGQIALGTAFGAAAGTLGAEASIISKRLLGSAAAATAAVAPRSFMARAAESTAGRAALGGLKEGAPEALQGGQEQFATNSALQNEGFDTPTWQGVAGNATLEALGGFGMGAGVEATVKRNEALNRISDAGSVDDAVAAFNEATAPDAPAAAPVSPRLANVDVMAEIRGLEPEQQQQALGLLATAQNPAAADGVRRFAQNQLDALLLPVRQLPVGEATEFDALPTGLATELTGDEIIGGTRGRFRTPDQIRTDGFAELDAAAGPPGVGLATEIQQPGLEVSEFDAIPTGEATELAEREPAGTYPPREPRTGLASGQAIDPAGPNAVRAYIDQLRTVNTLQARAYVREFDAGRITPAEVMARIVPAGPQTPQQRIEAAAGQAPTAPSGLQLPQQGASNGRGRADPADDAGAAAGAGLPGGPRPAGPGGLAPNGPANAAPAAGGAGGGNGAGPAPAGGATAALTPAYTDLKTADGMPYGTRAGASVRAKKEGGQVIEVDGGWIVRVGQGPTYVASKEPFNGGGIVNVLVDAQIGGAKLDWGKDGGLEALKATGHIDAKGNLTPKGNGLMQRINSREARESKSPEELAGEIEAAIGLRTVRTEQGATPAPSAPAARQRVTRDTGLVDGATIEDGQARQYRVHYQRNDLIVSHPIEGGKPKVSADTTVRFWTGDGTPSGDNDRTDPVYLVDNRGAAAPERDQALKDVDAGIADLGAVFGKAPAASAKESEPEIPVSESGKGKPDAPASSLDSEPKGGVLPPGFRGMTWRQAVDKLVAEHGRRAYVDGRSIMFPSGRSGQTNGIGNVPADVMQYATEALNPSAPAPVIQNRNRGNPASIQQMQSIAAAPDYGRLGFSRDFANGAPVIVADGIPADQLGKKDRATASDGRKIALQYAAVEADDVLASNSVDGLAVAEWDTTDGPKAIAGNGRIAGLKAAYAAGRADEYRAELEEDTIHGIDPEVLAGMDAPILVRVMSREDITDDIGDVSNTTGNLELSPVERARNDAARIDLEALEFSAGGDITTNTVIGFVRAMPKAEQGQLIDKNGQPTRQAYDRLEAAIFAKAYTSDELIRLVAQARDTESRNVMSALQQAAPSMAKLEGAGTLDIRGIVTEAAEIAVNARRNGVSLQRAAQQMDMAADPDVGKVLQVFADNATKVQAVVEALRSAAEFASRESSKDGADMFGDVERATRADVLAQLTGEPRGNERAGPQGVEVQGRREPDGGDAGAGAADAGSAADPEQAQGDEQAGEGAREGDAEGQAQRLKRDPAALPEGVRARLQTAIDRLQLLQEDLQRELDARGHGYTFKLFLLEKLPTVRTGRAQLNEFRKHAERNGFDAEAIIAKLGGDLNLEPFVVNDKAVSAKTPADERLLVMPCGDTKADFTTAAGELYQGPMWQTLRTHQPYGGMPNMLILSAKHGLIDQAEEIAPYDQRMTPARLAELTRDMQDNVAQLEAALKGRTINDVLIVGAADYRAVMAEAVAELMAKGLVKPGATVNNIVGQIGEQRAALGAYLRAVPGSRDDEGGGSVRAPSQPTPPAPAPAEPEPDAGLVAIPADPQAVADALQAYRAEGDDRLSALFGGTRQVNNLKTNPDTVGTVTPAEAADRLESWKEEARRQGATGENASRTVISLFDASGAWSQPWVDAGYNVVRYDLQDGQDIADFTAENVLDTHGNDEVWAILAAPPRTDFASSGAQFWKEKDADGRTEASNELVRQVLRTVELLRPPIWAMENPVGRVAKLNALPEAQLKFDPWHFGDPYTKRTMLWGNFANQLPLAPVDPTEGSKIAKLSSGAKYERSLTPDGFSYAFFSANNAAKGFSLDARLAQEFHGVSRVILADALYVGGYSEQQLRTLIEDDYNDGNLEAVNEKLQAAGEAAYPKSAQGYADQKRRKAALGLGEPAGQREADQADDQADGDEATIAEGKVLLAELTDDQAKKIATELGIGTKSPFTRRSMLFGKLLDEPARVVAALKAAAGNQEPAGRSQADDAIVQMRKRKSVLTSLLECLG